MAKLTHKKRTFLEALEQSLGIISTACKKAGISRQCFYNWRDKDEVFAKHVEAINEIALDYAETALFKNIKDGKETSIIFYLKTKGKHRGYIEKQQFDVANKTVMSIDMSKWK